MVHIFYTSRKFNALEIPDIVYTPSALSPKIKGDGIWIGQYAGEIVPIFPQEIMRD